MSNCSCGNKIMTSYSLFGCNLDAIFTCLVNSLMYYISVRIQKWHFLDYFVSIRVWNICKKVYLFYDNFFSLLFRNCAFWKIFGSFVSFQGFWEQRSSDDNVIIIYRLTSTLQAITIPNRPVAIYNRMDYSKMLARWSSSVVIIDSIHNAVHTQRFCGFKVWLDFLCWYMTCLFISW